MFRRVFVVAVLVFLIHEPVWAEVVERHPDERLARNVTIRTSTRACARCSLAA